MGPIELRRLDIINRYTSTTRLFSFTGRSGDFRNFCLKSPCIYLETQSTI